MTELLNCPFCGGKPSIEQDFISCRCDANPHINKIFNPDINVEEWLAKAWNTRATTERERALVDAFKGLYVGCHEMQLHEIELYIEQVLSQHKESKDDNRD